MPAFMKFGDIKGESRDEKHKDWINVLAYSWGVSQTGQTVGGGLGAGKAVPQDFSFSHEVDKASPSLFLACCQGARTPLVQVEVVEGREPSRGTFLKYKLYDVMITSVQQGSGGERPVEQLSFNYAKVEWSYFPVSDEGTPEDPETAAFDFRKNTRA